MKSKKLAMAIVALTMSATSALAFTACGDKHEHSYTWETTTEATCTVDGVKTGTCECGDTTTDAIPATGHNYTWETTTDATCTTAGVKTGTCASGDDTKTEEIAALGHKYGDWTITTYPTISEKGAAVKTCANDTAHEHDINVELPVLWDFASYDATEGDDGVTYVLANDNGAISFKLTAPESTDSKITVADADSDGMGYGKEVTFTPAKSGLYTLTLSTELDAAPELYESKEDFDNWMPALLSGGEYAPGLSANKELTAGTQYKFYFYTDVKGDYTLSVADTRPTVYNATVKGENTVSLKKDTEKLFVFKGDANKKYVVRYADDTQNNPSMYAVAYLGSIEYELTKPGVSFDGDNYLAIKTNSNGIAYFCLQASVDGNYKFNISDFTEVPATELVVTDAEGNAVTEYTVYLNEDDTVLLSYVKTVPNYATSELVYEIEDTTVANFNETSTWIRGLKVGDTKLTVKVKGTDIKKEVTLHVEEKVNIISVGDTVFDYTNEIGSLENLPTLYQFTGTPSTKYVVTFTEAAFGCYAWTIVDASDDTNYIDKWDTKVTYLEVTTNADGKASLLISGNGTGTLHVVLASEFEYPEEGGGEDGPATDLDGRYIVNLGDNFGYKIPASQATYFSFTGDANTEYTVALSAVSWLFGQCEENGEWIAAKQVNNELDWGTNECTKDIKTCLITTDANGVAYFRVNHISEIADLTLNIKKGKVDANGYTILAEGENGGVSLSSFANVILAINGDANTNYEITLSKTISMLGQCDKGGEWLKDADGNNKSIYNNSAWDTGEFETNFRTYTVTTDENGVAYVKLYNLSMTGIDDITVTVTKGEGVEPGGETGGEGGESDTVPVVTAPAVDATATGSATFTIADDATVDNEEEESYYRAVTFTPTETATYTVTVKSGDVVFTKANFEKYYDLSCEDYYNYLPFITELTGGVGTIELTANTEYTFVLVVFAGEHTFSIAKSQAE